MNYLNPEENPAPRPSKLTMTMKKGDLFRHEVAGGGGWGDPLERDPALVLQDVLNDFVSLRAAREDYGVVLGAEPIAVDDAGTIALREQIRRRRDWKGVPVYDWGTAMAAE
jgi:N-methylhydantoinase B